MRGLLAAIAAILLAFATPAAASNRGGLGTDGPRPVYGVSLARGAPAIAGREAWRTGAHVYAVSSRVVAEAERDLGSGKFTPWAGAWCADAASAWLVRAGKPPLANRTAASALSYGPHVADPAPGDLVVMRTNRGYAGHVGIVEGVNPDGSVAIISGNWGHRVARGVISRWQVTAFVRA